MQNIRIYAEQISNYDGLRDCHEQIIIHLRVIDNKMDLNLESFGYTNEWDDDAQSHIKFPFVANHDAKSDLVFLHFGDGESNLGDYRLNINQKTIEEGQLFTYFYPDHEYTYRIMKVTPL
jgi:hypothetical protein